MEASKQFVVPIIDEVYTAQKMEYSNGCFVGMVGNKSLAKTAVGFMAPSTCGRFKDAVCFISVKKHDSRLLKTWFFKVMQALDVLHVVAVSCDNHHVCNRKLNFLQFSYLKSVT